MRGTIVLCALLSTVIARPEGYYQEQYQYKSSASSYRNNELEHKDDDEGYYSRHGDLEGRAEPKVNSYSQHSEYTNPKFKDDGSSQALHQNDDFYTQWASGGHGSGSSQNTGSSGYGQGYQHGSSGNYDSTSGHGSTGSSSYQSSGYSGSATFGTTGHSSSLYPTQQLESLTQQLQNDLSRQLQNVINTQRQNHHSSTSTYGSYGSGNYGANIQLLEQELRNNLTQQLQQALNQQFGHQSQSGSQYYGVSSSGTHSSQPSYNTAELERLRKQLEDNLVRQLQQGLQTQSLQTSQSSSSSSSTSFGTGQTGGYGTSYRPSSTDSQTIHLTPGSHNTNSFGSSNYGSTSYGTSSTQGQYGVSQRPAVPLTDVTRLLERQLTEKLNKAVQTKVQQYTHSSSYHQSPDYQRELQILTDELQRNLTRELDSELLKNYGRQEQRGSYYYTIASGSAQSTPNYRVDELTNLRQQLQDKLARELQERYRQQYSQYLQSSYSTSSSQYGTNDYQQTLTDYNRPGQNTHSSYGTSGTHNQQTFTDYNRPSQNTHSSYGTAGTHNQHNTGGVITSYPSGSHGSTQGSYQVLAFTGNVPVELQDITKNAQADLAHQLQLALVDQQRRYQQQHGSSYSTSSSNYNAQDQQLILQRLMDELRRNVTEQLEQSISRHYGKQGQRGTYYYTISNGGSYNPTPNYNAQQLNEVTQQLQENLARQLQQNFYSTYSSSSSSSSYQQGSHSTGHTGAAYVSAGYNPTHSQSGSSSYQHLYGQSGQTRGLIGEDCDDMQNDDNFSRSYQKNQNVDDLTQKVDQHQVPQLFGQIAIGGQQKIDSSEDFTQQTQDEFGQLQIGGQQKMDDLTQQTEDDFGQLQIGGQQKVDDLTQQTEDEFGQLQIGGQQKVDDLTQQTEDEFGQLQIGGQQKVDDLSQQTEDEFGQLQIGGQQKVGHDDSTQQTEEFGQLHIGSGKNSDEPEIVTKTYYQTGYGIPKQREQDDQQTQQVVEGFGKLQVGDDKQDLAQQQMDFIYQNLYGNGQDQDQSVQKSDDMTQQTEHVFGQLHQQQVSDFTQQTENSHGNLHIGDQQTEDSSKDLAQQNEESFGQLQIGGQRPIDLTQQQEDLTQQTEDGFGKLQIGGQQQMEFGQQEDLSQQTETDYGKLQIGGQQREDSSEYFTQQSEDGFGKLQIGGQQQIDLTQQTEENHGKLQIGGNYQQQEDLTQQHQDNFGKLQIGRGHQQQEDLTQQTEDGFGQIQIGSHQQTEQNTGKLQIGGYGQQQVDLTQQTEDDFGHQTQSQLEFGSQQNLHGNHGYHSQGGLGYHNQGSLGYHTAHSSYGSGSSHRSSYGEQNNQFAGQLHYGTPQVIQDHSETTGDLNLQKIEKQNAQLLESLNAQDHKQSGYNHQSSYSSYSSSSHSSSSSSHSAYGGSSFEAQSGPDQQKHEEKSNLNVSEVDNETSSSTIPPAAQPEKGFWKKVGASLENTYTSAKQKAGSLIEKISSSVG